MTQTTLYIKYFSKDIADDALRAAFSRFGTVTSCQIARLTTGESKGFGYVSFSTADEAKCAISGMHEKMWLSQQLHVELFKKKVVRDQEKTEKTRKFKEALAMVRTLLFLAAAL